MNESVIVIAIQSEGLGDRGATESPNGVVVGDERVGEVRPDSVQTKKYEEQGIGRGRKRE